MELLFAAHVTILEEKPWLEVVALKIIIIKMMEYKVLRYTNVCFLLKTDAVKYMQKRNQLPILISLLIHTS